MSIMAKTPSGYKKIGSAYLGERPVDKVFNANGDVVYTLQRELTGVPPLLFKGKEQSELLNYRICGNTETKQRDYSGSSPLTVPVHDGELYNYRIYGNTVNGESVGDRTGNLFDGFSVHGMVPSVSTGELTNSPSGGATTDFIAIDNGDITLSKLNAAPTNMYIFLYAQDKSYIGYSQTTAADMLILYGNSINGYQNAKYARIRVDAESAYTQTNIMLNSGSMPLPYEPYGYKVPLTVSNGTDTLTTPIYLPEPIKMVGSEAEYVDFYSQKQYFADGTNTAVTIPALPISTGTNTVTVNTTVQPSSVEVSTDENVSVGDLVTSGEHAGEYKVPVTVEGKNLFDLNTWANTIQSISGDGVMSISGSTVSITSVNVADCYTEPYANSQTGVYKMPVKPNTIYTVNWYGSNYRIIIFENGSSNYIYNFFSDKPQSFTTHSDTTFLTLRFGVQPTNPVGTTATISEFIISEGSTALPYEPYHAPITTPIYLPEPIKMVGDEAEYIDYGEQKLHRVRKNLFDEINGVVTDEYIQDNGTININPNGDKYIYNRINVLPNTTYTFSWGKMVLGTNDYPPYIRVAQYDSNGNFISRILVKANDFPNNRWVMTVKNDVRLWDIRIDDVSSTHGQHLEEMMLNSGSTPLPYEPYIENVDLDVTLPALPTIKGTNTMSVDTEVQPSRMDIKGRIKTLT